MKTIAFLAALAAAVAAAPVYAAGADRLPQTFNDQGHQVPAFPGDR